MKFTLSWLKDHLETDASLETITDTLTRIGLEVEAVTNRAADLSSFIVARIVTAEQHPNADRLRICSVDIGSDEPVQVVCGASNAQAGLVSVFAPPGTVIPSSGTTIAVGSIRGVESRGMLCSGAELGLSMDAEGILSLPQEAPVGQAYATYAGFDDPIIDINLTPNRADCAGVQGIARDLSAAGLGKLKGKDPAPIRGAAECQVAITRDLALEDEKLCPLFALRQVANVRNGPSPEWMQRRLKAVGLRPINALVDITNAITLDQCRPLHVFDAAKVQGNLVVRLARTGETLAALDKRTYALDESTVVIADDSGPISIAGIMGGEATGCDETTTDVLIESALWNPLTIAQTGRRLGISSDARYRFERGVDPEFCLRGLDLATHLVVELCGGQPSERAMEGDVPDTGHAIDFSWTETKRLTGLDVLAIEQRAILSALGFHVSGNSDRVRVAPPSWRADVEGKADLVEEIVRIAGFDRIDTIPLPPPDKSLPKPSLTLLQKRTRSARRALSVRGLVEAITWSFIAEKDSACFSDQPSAVPLNLANPIAADLSTMRPSLVPGLLKAAQRNADRNIPEIGLFEVGQIFSSFEPDGQKIAAAGVRYGSTKVAGTGQTWLEPKGLADVFDAKADALALLAALGVPMNGLHVVPGGPAWLHPGQSGRLQFGPKQTVGVFGALHPSLLKTLDLKGSFMVFEVVLDALPPPKIKPTKTKQKLVLSGLQPVTRDLAFVMEKSVSAADLLRAVQGAHRTLIAQVTLFDVYEGDKVLPTQKSLAVAVTLQPMDKTLTDKEIEEITAKIIEDVARKTGATLRA